MINSARRERDRESLENILRLRKDKRYRKGLLQGAVSFGIISQEEWEVIEAQIDSGEKEIVIPRGEDSEL